ncbi:transposase [Fodinibius salsisoli]|uniref:Transposase n=1 Tax=Fodinibius salsisoli TaxID=2820877 RepID=A0ABT3PMD4_9BACT|nr:transposase [Fodinibius salsisoli]MCW9707087.1 transposase [Fodinibius salsisoli]
MSNYYRRNLPHYQPPQGEFFITFRLANSLPKDAVAKLRDEYYKLSEGINSDAVSESKKAQQEKYFAKFDRILDQSKNSVCWLKEDKIAEIVANKLHSFDNRKYLLICYCIMPNHVHLLFKLYERDKSRSTDSQYPVTNILKLIKGSTAYQANKLLNKTGSFWQHESYDHLVRGDEERENIIRYILSNPVKAKLVDSWKEWKWIYCKKAYFPVR